MKRLIFLSLLIALPALAQNPATPLPTTATNPNGQPCQTNAVLNYVPSGVIYTCKNGYMAPDVGTISACASNPPTTGTAGQVCVIGTSQYLCHTTGPCLVAGDWTLVGPIATLVTSVGSPGSDTNVPSEKAVRAAIPSAAVASVFGRTGAVTAASGDYTASQVGLGNVTNDAQLKASQLVTTVGNPGSDANVPSEKAVRTALAGSGGGVSYGAGGGAADAQTVTVSPAITSQPAGTAIIVLPGYANATATPTLAANSLTALTITVCGTQTLSAGDLSTTADAFLISDGTHWQLQNPQRTRCAEVAYPIGVVTTTAAIAPANGAYQTMTLTAATGCTATFTQPATGTTTVTVVVTQAATPTGTVTWTSVKWPGGIAPVMTASAGAIDVYSFKLDGLNIYGTAAQNMK